MPGKSSLSKSNMEDIFRKDALFDFWPSARQTAKERVEATTRFIVYATVLLLLIRRDPRILALGGLVLVILYVLYNNGMIPDGPRTPYAQRVPGISMPTRDNPMANPLIGDDPMRPSAAWYPSVKTEIENEWSQIHPFERVRDAERNFYTTASTTIPNNQSAFAQAAYGRMFEPQCRDTPGACDPDGPYSTFPERVQLRGGNGGGFGGPSGGGGF